MDNQANEMELTTSLSGEESPDRTVKPGEEFPDELLAKLVGAPAGQSAKSDSEGAPEGKPADQPTLNALAESKGLKLDDLYKATVALPDEQGTATIEQLKNDATKFRKGQAQQAQTTQDQTDFSNQKLKYLSELQTAVAALPAEILQDEAKMAPVAQFLASQQDQENRLLLEVIPGWHDEAVRAKDGEGIKAFLASEYGAPTASWDQPAPAWARKLVYDYWQLSERMKAISGKRKASKASKSGPNVPSAAVDRRKGAVSRAHAGGDKLDAITDLLKG